MNMMALDPAHGAAALRPAPRGAMPAVLLVAGIALAALTEAIASTALSMARFDMIGDTHATLDQFARLEVGYTGAKLVAFVLAPWLMGALSPQTALRAATACMTLVCGAAALTADLETLLALRLVQGLAGGALLVSGQTVLFQVFSRPMQPVVQCLFAIGAVVAPATLAPSMQGWLLDTLSWTWIFLAVVPVGLAALALLAATALGARARVSARSLDWPGLALFTAAAFCLTYGLEQGNRWRWFDEPAIVWLVVGGLASLALFVVRQRRAAGGAALLDLSVFRDSGFAFGFLASFAAGFALFGSAYLIPSFAVSILSMTPTEAGTLLLPSSLMFVGTLLLSALLIRRRHLPPVATVPLGIACFILAMWMLSGASGESGFADLLPAVLVRGLALGFLFLSITLITLGNLRGSAIAYGVGLFNIGRQTGGLIGVAVLETLIDHHAATGRAALAAHVVPGRVEVAERIATLAAGLAARGMEAGSAAGAATQILVREVARQASVNAFDTAFLAVALFFVAAAPLLIGAKVIIGRVNGPRRGRAAPRPSRPPGY